jgi:hypothetical protein
MVGSEKLRNAFEKIRGMKKSGRQKKSEEKGGHHKYPDDPASQSEEALEIFSVGAGGILKDEMGERENSVEEKEGEGRVFGEERESGEYATEEKKAGLPGALECHPGEERESSKNPKEAIGVHDLRHADENGIGGDENRREDGRAARTESLENEKEKKREWRERKRRE